MPGGTGNFGTYLPKSEQKDVLFFKIMPKTTRQKLKSQCPNVPGGTGNFGTYLPKSEQKDQNNAKKPLDKNLSPRVLTCSLV